MLAVGYCVLNHGVLSAILPLGKTEKMVLTYSELWELAHPPRPHPQTADMVRERPQAAKHWGVLLKLSPIATSSPTLEGNRRVD